MMAAVYLALAILAVGLFAKKKDLAFLFVYYAIVSKLFMLDLTDLPASICGDICILINFALVPVTLLRGGKYSSRNDVFARMIYLFIGFYLLEFIITVISGAESLVPAVKVVRIPLMLLAFFPLRLIPVQTYSKFLKLALYLTLAQAVLFYLQFVGIHLLNGFDEEKIAREGFVFASNIPHLAVFYLFYLLKVKGHLWLIIPTWLFLFGAVILTFTRGTILAALAGLVYFLVINNDRKQLITFGLLLLFILPLTMTVFSTKSSNRGSSMVEELKQLTSGSGDVADNVASGTFAFRIAMLFERFNYLKENPRYLPLGVGTIHEDSPKCTSRFDFLFGTENEGRLNGQCIIESGDIAWVPVLLRYGIVGVIVHLAFYLTIIIVATKRKYILSAIAPLFVFYLIRSIDGGFFELHIMLYLSSFFMSLLARGQQEYRKKIT